MAKRIFLTGTVADGSNDSEIMSADYPDLRLPSIIFLDGSGQQVTPSAGTVTVSVSADGVNFINIINGSFSAIESYNPKRQIPSHSGLATVCRITFSGIVGAESFNALIWRGEADQELPLSKSPNGNERLKVDIGQTGFWDGREFRTGIDKTANYTLKVVAPINFILQLQVMASHNGEATFKAYGASQISAEATSFNDAIQILPNNGMTDTPVYVPQIAITGGGSITLNGTQEPRESIKIKTASATAQQSTVGGSAIKERGLPAGTYYLVFTGTDYSYRLIYEERP